MNPVRWLARFLFRDYSVYRIYHMCMDNMMPRGVAAPEVKKFRFRSVPEGEIRSSLDQLIAEQAWYHGEDVHAYACLDRSRIVGLCFFWYGKRYGERNFWPLAEKEAKLVQLIVLPEMRNMGIARDLIRFAVHDMAQRGFEHAYARIWWNNEPSQRAFENAGWKPLATVAEFRFRGQKKPFRFKWKSNP